MSYHIELQAAKDWLSEFGSRFSSYEDVSEDAEDIFDGYFTDAYGSDEETPFAAYYIDEKFYILLIKTYDLGGEQYQLTIAEDYYVITHNILFDKKHYLKQFLTNVGISLDHIKIPF